MSEDSSRAWKDQYMLRLPDGLRDRIKRAAERNGRSMNAEIVSRLERIYPAPLDIGPTVDVALSMLQEIKNNPDRPISSTMYAWLREMEQYVPRDQIFAKIKPKSDEPKDAD